MAQLAPFLESLFERYHRPDLLTSDPLEFPHRFQDPWDQEAVALLSALLAYGNVKQIRASVSEALKRIEKQGMPASFARQTLRDPLLAKDVFTGYVHRFNVGDDLAVLFELLGRSWNEYGSLGGHILMHQLPGESIESGLIGLIGDWKVWAKRLKAKPSFYYLLTSPVDGSVCKRWCMLLRWMVRKDELDLGLWSGESPLAVTFPALKSFASQQLVIPLDTHTGRISQYLSLTRRKSLNWKAALEVTAALKACDRDDPVKYDFALSRLGILDLCQKKYRREICEKCELLEVCRFAKKGRRA